MKTIIAGSGSLSGLRLIETAVKLSGFRITQVVSGRAPGIDVWGEQWAENNGISVRPFPANWKDFSKPCFIKVNSRGEKYNALAGFKRNKKMAVYADALIAVWNGQSPGTKNMIKEAKRHKLKIYVYRTDGLPAKVQPRPIVVIKRHSLLEEL